jgi:hypothetical protein
VVEHLLGRLLIYLNHRLIVALLTPLESLAEKTKEILVEAARFDKGLAKSREYAVMRTALDVLAEQNSSRGVKHGIVGAVEGRSKTTVLQQNASILHALGRTLKVLLDILSHKRIPSCLMAW